MSLLDGLLRDPYRDPKNVWIALRADGQRGSGTIDDPYDGGSRLAPALAATLSFTASDVTGQTAEVHGYQPGDYVTIFGVTGTDAAAYNGSFPVSEVSASTALDQFFKHARAGSPTAGPSGTSVFVRKGRLFNIDLTSAPDPVPNLTVVTVDTAPENHGYANGDTVAIFGVTGAGAPFFNVNSTPITLTPGSTTEFKFTLTGLPAAAPAGSTTVCIRNSIGTSPAVPIPLLRVGLARQVTITTGASHGCITGDRVAIAGASHTSLNGSFLITKVTDTSFTYITTYDPAATAGGAVTCAKVVRRFDEVMRSLTAEGVSVHIGPGTFETRGFAGYADTTAFDWQPRSGWRLAGAGIGVTTLKLVDAIPDRDAARLYTAVGTAPGAGFLMGFEAVDFTVDANVAGQPSFAGRAFPLVVCGAVYVIGRHIRLRRLRCINFGSQSPARECFVLVSSAGNLTDPEAFDNVTHDCLVEQPGRNNTQAASLIGMGAILDPNSGRVTVHRACVVRDCFVDAAYVDRPVPILSMSLPSGGQATVTTRGPHGRAAGDWVVISGALDEKGDPSASYNGSFLIPPTSVPGTNTFEITITGNPTVVPGGQMFVGRAPSDPVVAADDASNRLVPTLIGPSLYSVLLNSFTPHFRTPQNNVLVFGAKVNTLFENPYNGAFPIDVVVSPIQLKYTTTYTGPNSIVLPKPDGDSLIGLGVIFPGAGVVGGRSGVSERNRVFNSRFATNHDSFNSPDSTFRHCLFSGVYAGAFENMGGIGALRILAALVQDRTDDKIANGTTSAPHGLASGDAVQIANAKVRNVPSEVYNGFFVVDVTGEYHFSYTMGEVPEGSAADADTAKFGQLWQTKRLVVENNVIDLGPSDPGASRAPAAAFWAGEASQTFGQHPGVYIFNQLIIRENVIRQIENAAVASSRTLAAAIASAEAALVDGNIIALDNPKPIEHSGSLAVRPFNNVSPDGRLIPTVDQATGVVAPELSTAIQDALLMALL